MSVTEEKLVNDVKSLKDDISKIYKAIEKISESKIDNGKDSVANIASNLHVDAHRLGKEFYDFLNKKKDYAEDVYKHSKEIVQENPLVAIGGGFMCGVVIALLLVNNK